jgi:hypothetical protein
MAIVQGTVTVTQTPAKVFTQGPTGSIVQVPASGANAGVVYLGGPTLTNSGATQGPTLPITAGATLALPGGQPDQAGPAETAPVTDDVWACCAVTGACSISYLTNY